MDLMNMPVTLVVVKAPNQRVEDQTVECMLGWTVKKLKAHLSQVYPSQPVSIHMVPPVHTRIYTMVYANLWCVIVY